MTPLRQRMLDDMQIRNLAPATQRAYVEHVGQFARHFGRSPAGLGPEEIRAYHLPRPPGHARRFNPHRRSAWAAVSSNAVFVYRRGGSPPRLIPTSVRRAARQKPSALSDPPPPVSPLATGRLALISADWLDHGLEDRA